MTQTNQTQTPNQTNQPNQQKTNPQPNQKTALITGANRGIGLQLALQLTQNNWHTIATSRHNPFPQKPRSQLLQTNPNTTLLHLDLNNPTTIQQTANHLQQTNTPLHLLINNAAILIDQHDNLLKTNPDTLLQTITTNTLAPIHLIQTLLPHLKKATNPTIINLTSALATLQNTTPQKPAYTLSKIALNAATRQLAHNLKPHNITITAISPGWVHTQMGGPNAPRTPQTAAQKILQHLNQPNHTLHAQILRDGKKLPY